MAGSHYNENNWSFIDWKPECIFSIFSDVVINEAESTWGSQKLVEAHYYSFNITSLSKKLVQLLLGCVERHVANVKSAWLLKKLLL